MKSPKPIWHTRTNSINRPLIALVASAVLISMIVVFTMHFNFIWSDDVQADVHAEAALRMDFDLYSPDNPLYIPHKGGALMYPEHTLGTYVAALAAGSKVLELDVYKLMDGTSAVFHDPTVDRVTTSTGEVVDLDRATFKALYVASESWHGANIPDMHETQTLDEVLHRFKHKVSFVIEAKNEGAGAAIVAEIRAARVPASQIIIQSFMLKELKPARKAGFNTMILIYGDTTKEMTKAKAAGVQWVGLGKLSSDETITAWITGGFKVSIYTENRRWRRDELLALGVSSFFTDDPLYLSSDLPYACASTFDKNTWMPGMLAYQSSLTAVDRGRFYDGYWGWNNEVTFPHRNRNFVLQGWASPTSGKFNDGSYTITFTARFGVHGGTIGADSTWIGIFIADASMGDREYLDDGFMDAKSNGYLALFRANGTLDLYSVTAGRRTQLGSTSTTTAISAGSEAAFRLKIKPANIRLSRVSDNSDEDSYLEVATTLYRGSYFSLGRGEGAVMIKDIVVTSKKPLFLANHNPSKNKN